MERKRSMKEKTIVLLAIALAIFAMLISACTGMAASRAYPSADEPVCAAPAPARDAGLALAVYIEPCDAV